MNSAGKRNAEKRFAEVKQRCEATIRAAQEELAAETERLKRFKATDEEPAPVAQTSVLKERLDAVDKIQTNPKPCTYLSIF